jgi:hypothetical protein
VQVQRPGSHQSAAAQHAPGVVYPTDQNPCIRGPGAVRREPAVAQPGPRHLCAGAGTCAVACRQVLRSGAPDAEYGARDVRTGHGSGAPGTVRDRSRDCARRPLSAGTPALRGQARPTRDPRAVARPAPGAHLMKRMRLPHSSHGPRQRGAGGRRRQPWPSRGARWRPGRGGRLGPPGGAAGGSGSCPSSGKFCGPRGGVGPGGDGRGDHGSAGGGPDAGGGRDHGSAGGGPGGGGRRDRGSAGGGRRDRGSADGRRDRGSADGAGQSRGADRWPVGREVAATAAR